MFLCLAPLFRLTQQAANVNPMISTFFKVVTPRCTFRNLTGGAVVVTTWMLLRRSPNLEAFTNAIQRTVLPLGTYLRALSEGSTRFTIQAENISALDALWRSYQDETLQTVYIDEDEYRNAMLDLIKSGTKGNYTFNGPAIMHDSLCEMNKKHLLLCLIMGRIMASKRC